MISWPLISSMRNVAPIGASAARPGRRSAPAGNAPRTVASLRNLAISARRLIGHTNITKALRHIARDFTRPLTSAESPPDKPKRLCRTLLEPQAAAVIDRLGIEKSVKGRTNAVGTAVEAA
ncbi:hypothetical protein MOQ72_17870 [Saccharopolyspora sp. K220]|uniref:hypothetical protein n=1 Tax=Saccharopolyspora soli TaxID=2926618 RepID=UPI001F5896EA|nr:hypothetical protein [Saccharopolyspora soli]MCI2419315.1 hypothetical protein [Saccharopolyspora soli]